MAPDFQEEIVQQILRLTPVSNNPPRNREQQTAVTIVQLGQCTPIAFSNRGDETRIGHTGN